MKNEVFFEGFFPTRDRVPEPHRLRDPLEQREYLCNGRIIDWDGPVQEVYSPICIESSAGAVPERIGSYPLLTAKEASTVLDAACQAYDHGRGTWPALSVEDRIRHVEDFAYRMQDVPERDREASHVGDREDAR